MSLFSNFFSSNYPFFILLIIFLVFFVGSVTLVDYGTTDLLGYQLVKVSSDRGSKQRLADVSSTSSDEEEEEEEGDVDREEGGDSNEESEEDSTELATLKEILAEVATPGSSSFR